MLSLAFLGQHALAEETLVVGPKTVADEKAVFATVESADIVPARARIGGTVADLTVKEGDAVKEGQVVATVVDEKMALQMKSLDAQIAGLEAQFASSEDRSLPGPGTRGTGDRAENTARRGTDRF